MLNYKHIEVHLARASTLPLLPHVATQLLSISDATAVSTKEYERLIIQDPAMVAKLLRTANSPLFGGGGRITSLQRAMSLLGFDTVRSICIMVALQSSTSNRKMGVHFSAASFWQHGIAVASIAKVLAVLKRYTKPEEAFLAGLLHDIGKLAIAMFLPNESREISIRTRADGIADIEAERLLMQGVSHEDIGAEVASRWGLPTLYGEVIAHHHTLSRDTEPSQLVQFVHAANVIAYQQGMGFGVVSGNSEIDALVQMLLGMEPEQYTVIGEKVEGEVTKLVTSLCQAA
jgi:putative nucleotidyltransferase with HDIG domain